MSIRISSLPIISSLALAVIALACLFLSGLASPAQAAGLTDVQIQAIVSLLSSFGADSNVIANVSAALHGQATTGGAAPASSCLSLSHNLYAGLNDSSTGGEVTQLQQFLGVSATGYFGPLTAAAVVRWQAVHGIAQVGTVGPLTRASFACGTANPPAPTPPATSTTPNTPVVPPTPTTTPATPAVTLPSCTITTDKDLYYFNDSMTISWTSQNATYVTFAPNTASSVSQLQIFGTYLTQGSVDARANISGTPMITLKAYSANGVGTCTKTVTVRTTS